MGGLITGSAFTKQFPSINTTTANGNAQLQGFVVAIYNIGCWAGSLLTMVVGERLGRKKTIMFGALVLAIGTIIQCSAYGLAQLMVRLSNMSYLARRARPPRNTRCLLLMTVRWVDSSPEPGTE